MYQIQLIPLTGKWKIVLPNGEVLGDKYSSSTKAAYKLYKYIKSQN